LDSYKKYDSYKAFTIETIILNEPLAFDLYINNSNRLVKFIKLGDTLSSDKKEKLLQNRVDHFYIASHHSQEFDTYLTNHLGKVLSSPDLNKKQKSKILYASATHIMQDMFESEISQTKIMIAKDIMAETVKKIISNDVTAASILQLSTHDYQTYSHCVNVALYSIGMAHQHGLDEEMIYKIASGAILHDLGKCKIDQCIINKQGKLSLDEFEAMKEHPQYSYETLIGNGETCPIILEIVLNHHEKLDGSGYGRALRENDISFAAQIVTIADIFDALTSDRSYKEAASFFDALKIMKDEMRDQLNIKLVDSLIKMMGKA